MTNDPIHNQSNADVERHIETVLQQILPPHLQRYTRDLARILVSAADGTPLQVSSPEQVEALRFLQDRALPTPSGTIKVGEISGEGIAIGHGASATVIKLAIHTSEQAYDVRGLANPYLGLAAFTYAERAKYAGRERVVEQAVELLTTPGKQRVLLFITGASGSGKSSLAQAGLLPALV
jgi:chromosomal replication initiation ATPase DnaA